MNEKITPARPWRICALGASFVKEHRRKSKNGSVIIRAHCRASRLRKEILNVDEIREIFVRNQDRKIPFPNSLDLGFNRGNHFDRIIGLWSAFWNDVFPLDPTLDPNWVKVLIATESSFSPDIINRKNRGNHAFGLMQITEKTHKILTDSKGELKDVLFRIDQKDLLVPEVNIAAGIRWLFRKREILKSRIKRDPSWEEAMWEYKGIYDQSNLESHKIRAKLLELYEKISSRT